MEETSKALRKMSKRSRTRELNFMKKSKTSNLKLRIERVKFIPQLKTLRPLELTTRT